MSTIQGYQGYDRFNIYDIFTNFLPGSILLIGIGITLLKSPIQESTIFNFSVPEGVVLAIIAFVIGFGLQALASLLSSLYCRLFSKQKPFDNYMDTLKRGEEEFKERHCRNNGRVNISSHDFMLFDMCKQEFELGKDFDNWSSLFKILIAYIEGSPWSRALRIQALHLSARGMAMSFTILSIFYLLIFKGCISGTLDALILADDKLFTLTEFFWLALGCAILALMLYMRSRHFEADVVRYLMAEFYLDQTSDSNIPL